LAYARELYSGKCAIVVTYIPPGNEVAVRWLVVYLRRCGQREIELRRKMKMEIEVLFRCGRLGTGIRQARDR
jgi:hypothetical protein